VIDALMALAAERSWNSIALADIAERAELTLAELRDLFPSKGAILAALARRTDQAVLDGIDPSLHTKPARDRLFEVLIRRLEVLAPHKAGLKGLRTAFRYDPLALMALNRTVLTSMQWMLAAASIESEAPKGAARAQGLVLAWSRILTVWFEDDSEALSRTRAEIDRQLRSGEWWMERMSDLWTLTRPLRQAVECSVQGSAKLKDRFHAKSSQASEPDPNRAGAEAI
jgi:AcrR family transcriptional regulator